MLLNTAHDTNTSLAATTPTAPPRADAAADSGQPWRAPGTLDTQETDSLLVAPAPPIRDFRRLLGDTTPRSIPESPAGDLLQSWIQAHNAASAEALRHWLRASLNPAISDTDVDKRLDWYVAATRMFGPLSNQPLAILENEPHRLLVHLVRSDMGPRERLDPLNIVVVELDVDAQNPRYLARGLGLGALACEAHEDDPGRPEEKR
jgi:hypothetical protein